MHGIAPSLLALPRRTRCAGDMEAGAFGALPRERKLEAVIDLRLAHEDQRSAFEETLRELPAVASAVHLTGPFDYQLRLACHEATEIDATVAELKRRKFVRDTQTRVVLRQVL
jgi:Lrp/AsnC family leucine-responsive transcriptional regulator